MAISEKKMQMVIANYFKDECDVNTSIRQAFEKGFRIGVKKGASTNRPQGWVDKAISIIDDMQREGIIDYEQAWEFRMRARMKGADDE